MVRKRPVSRPPFMLVAGPTASGKSELGINLAKEFNGEIINIDAVQVYRELEIGAAKIDKETRKRVLHHCIDICSPADRFDAAAFKRAADNCSEEIIERGKQRIFVGGSTLYIKVLVEGLADLPRANALLRSRLGGRSSESLYRLLTRFDRERAAELHRNDRIRIIRALETVLVSGKSMSELKAEHRRSKENEAGIIIVLCWPRDELYSRIDLRTGQMIASGLIEEVNDLYKRYGKSTALSALGYSQVISYLEGKLKLDDLEEEIARATRRYAKRQMTFWRNEPVKAGWQIRPIAAEADRVIGDEKGNSPATGRNPIKGISVMSLSYPELCQRLRNRLSEPLTIPEVWYVDASFFCGDEA